METNSYVRREYDRLALNYDDRWKGYLNSTNKVALRLFKPRMHEVILDASGGTGLLAEQVINRIGGDSVIDVMDISDEMLRQAEKRLKGYPNVKISRNDVHELRFDNESFSTLFCVSAFHYYHNPEKVISEFRRVLKQEGSLILIDWCRDKLHFKLFDAVMRTINKSHFRIYTTKEIEKLLVNDFNIENIEVWSYGLWSLMGIKATKRGK